MSKNNDTKKARSIRLNDKDYEQLKEKAKAAHLRLSDYIVKRGLDECETIPPDILCRLEALQNIMTIPLEALNDSLKNKYAEDLKEVCVRLFW